MPTFRYKGYTGGGTKAGGTVDAENEAHALRLIRQRGVFPTWVDSAAAGRRPAETTQATRDRASGSSSPPGPMALAWALRECRDHTADFLDQHRAILLRVLPAVAVAALLVQTWLAFPVGSPALMTLVGLVLVVLAAVNLGAGLLLGLVVLFSAVAFHRPLAGCLFAAAASVAVIASKADPRRAIVLLLSPLVLQAGFGLAMPLVAGLYLPPQSAAWLAGGCALAGLGYMAVGGLHCLGPLVLNAAPGLVSEAGRADPDAFFGFEWVGAVLSPQTADGVTVFASGLFPAILRPPLALIEVAGWGTAAYAMARLYRRQSWRLALAAGGCAVAVLLVADAILRQLPGALAPAPRVLVGSLFAAVALVAVLAAIAARPRPQEVAAETTFASPPEDVAWEAIGGLADVKKEIQVAIQHRFDTRTARLARQYGLTTVKGILFYGPPGCGKTMFAKVVASQARARFFSVSGADIRSKWYGEAEQNIAKVFTEARQYAPSVVFFDEIDHLLGRREQTMHSDSPDRRIVAQFLNELDGVKELANVLVIGATNEPDLIDPAALRPGRFDKLIYIPLPDAPARAAVFRVHLRGKPLADDVNIDLLARLTERFSGADIANLCVRAAEQCMHQSLEGGGVVRISMASFEGQIKSTKPSVSLKLIEKYEQLREKYNRRALPAETGAYEEREAYTWAKIGGLQLVRKELEEAIEMPLRKPEAYEKFGVRPPKGVLLLGPPGCGKTLMAKIVAHECGAHFLSVDAKKENAESIREWFLRARENKPCVLFFDEVDALAVSRDSFVAHDPGVVTQLLVEMDGMKDLEQVVVVAATNRPDVLDEALLRPGRFDRLIYVPPPDQESRLQILRIHLATKPLATDVDLEHVARQTEGYSGADLASVCYEVSMTLVRAADSPDPRIHAENFIRALQKIRPSIRPEAMAYYEKMRERFRRG